MGVSGSTAEAPLPLYIPKAQGSASILYLDLSARLSGACCPRGERRTTGARTSVNGAPLARTYILSGPGQTELHVSRDQITPMYLHLSEKSTF